MQKLTTNNWVIDASPEPSAVVEGMTHYGIHLFRYLPHQKNAWVEISTGDPATMEIFAWRLINSKYNLGHIAQPDWANLPTRRFTATDTPKGEKQ